MNATSKTIPTNFKFSTIEDALTDIKAGKVVIVVDDEDRENEGDFIAAAELITPETINFMALNGRGLLCTPLSEERCHDLDLDLMVGKSTDPKQTAFTVSVDLLGDGVTTGISAADRAKTILALMEDNTRPEQLSRPGHVFPLRAVKGGVLRRPGHTEAAMDLTKLAGLKPGGVIVEIMNDDGTMSRLPELITIAEKFDLKLINIQDLIAYRLQKDSLIERVDKSIAQTFLGDAELFCYKQTTNDQVHFALKFGDWKKKESVPVRVISTKSYYDLFSALANGENPQLENIHKIIQTHQKGAIVFINNVQDSDTLMAKWSQFNKFLEGKAQRPTLAMDEKDYGIGAQIIKDLGIERMQIISSTPQTNKTVSGYGLEIVGTIVLD